MPGPWFTRVPEGRHRAAFFVSVAIFFALFFLAGCGGHARALRATMQGLVPWHQNVSQRAAELPYASIDLLVNGHGGLLVLAELSQGNAYFQSANRNTIVMHNGYLDQATGAKTELLMTRLHRANGRLDRPPWRSAEGGVPFEYLVQRLWRTFDGTLHAGQAQATLVCETVATERKLPLASLSLQRCRESLLWSNGATTQSTLWRDPVDQRLWAVQTVPWPDAPEFQWQVARPWW